MKSVIKDVVRRSSAYRVLGNHVYRFRGKIFDWKYNIQTAREVELDELRIDSPNSVHGVRYAGSDPKFFRKFLLEWEIPYENFVFVDLGSGKGRVLLMASEQPFKKIVGVEFSSELHQIAQSNIRNYKNPAQKCRSVESVCLDAAHFAPPPEPSVFYIFNAFSREILTKVLRNLENSLVENPREIYIFYTYAVHKDILQASPMFKEISSGVWHSLYQSVQI